MKLSEICIKRPVLTIMMNLALVLFGLIGLSRLPVRELPDIDPPIVNVQTVYPGASASVVETQLTEPIEGTLTSIEGIKKLTSESREQVSSITIEFDLSRSVDVAAQDVRDRVARVRGRLPDDIDEPIVSKQDADAQPSLWIALYSDRYSTLELTKLAEDTFKDRLQTVPGVSSVILGGSKRFAIRIWLDSEKMAARNITVLDVEEALQSQNVELPSGRVESWERELAIETQGELKTPEEYNNLVIKQDGSNFVRLRDIGYANVGVEDERSVARFNSKPAVGIGVIKQSKANTIEVARGIKEELARMKDLIPAGVVTSIPYDESVYVEKSIHEVWLTLFIAFGLVILTIYVFLHTFRATLIPSVTIPVSIIGTFAVLYAFGFSINIVTMLAFVLAIGLVVDDAIVVLENIHRHIEEGMKPFDAAISSMKEIGFAVIATSVALVAVFLPMAFQTSITGRLFIEFAVAVSFGVIISTFVALTLAPMLSARVLKSHMNEKLGILGFFERWITGLSKSYENTLLKALRHPVLIIFISVCALAGALFFYTKLESEFLPEEDKGRLFCFILAPEGSTSEYTDKMVRKMEKIVAETPEVDGYFSAVALARGGPGQSAQGLSFIRLKEERKRHVRDIVGGPDGLRGKFFGTIEGALVIPIIPKAIGRGFSQDFQLVLQNQNLEELNSYANELSNKLRGEGFLVNVRSTFEMNKPQLRVSINRNRAAVLGISVEDISKTLQILFGGSDLTKINLAGKEYDVIVQLERASRLSPQDLDKLYIRNIQGDLIQLSNVVTYETGGGPSSINHFNRFRSATIEATPVDIPLGTAVNRVKSILKEDLPSGFRYEWNGEAADLVEASNQIGFVIILAIIIIYMVLASQFESLVHPLTILMTLPLAAFGAFGALYAVASFDQFAAATPALAKFVPRIPAMGINLFSQIGLILLIGIVTKNGILLVDFANQQMAKGKDAATAMIEAGKIRFRPILMTAMSTVAGIMPIAIGFGAGAESRRPLGVVAVGGLLTSTLLTLFVIPVVYVLLSKLGKKNSKKSANTVKSTVGIIAVVAASAMLAGCITPQGPNYRKPKTTVPTKWKASEGSEFWKKAVPADHAAKGAWWEIFEDKTLNRLEEQAITYNQDLKSAMANVDRARALARIERGDFYPTLALNPEYSRSRTTKNSFTSSSSASTSFTSDSYTVPFDLSYELDLWGRVRRSFEAGVAEAQASAAAYQNVLLTLTADVARNYFLLRELDKEIVVLDETIKLRQYASDVVKQRADAGVSSELDFNRAKTELAKAEAEKIDVLRRRAEIENALAVLCGQVASDFIMKNVPLDVEPPQVPLAIPSHLLERRPDIAEHERLVMAANAKIGVVQAAFFPVIKFTGSGGYESISSSNLFDWESRTWSLGPSVSIPIFAGGRNKAHLEATEAEYDQTVADYRQKVLEAIAEVETSLSNLDLHAQQSVTQNRVVTSARETANLSISRYKQGLVTFLEVVDAERSRLEAELEATRILSHRLTSTVQLIKALGGSWE